MRLIGLAVVIISGVLAQVAAETQESAKVYRIGWLAPAPLPTTLDAFRDGLRVLGHVEGNNIVIEQRYAMGKPERFAPLVAELVRTNVDVIVTTGNQATAVAKSTAASIPVVSLLQSRPSRFICILRTDPVFGRSWSDGLGSSLGHCGPLFARSASWRWRTWRCGSKSRCGRRASHGHS
jgi:hypothetical protein